MKYIMNNVFIITLTMHLFGDQVSAQNPLLSRFEWSGNISRFWESNPGKVCARPLPIVL